MNGGGLEPANLCRIPDKRLVIRRGDLRKYGPAILEIRTEDGRLLKRIERQQVSVAEITAADDP